MILKIRDIHAFARDVAVDNGTLVFARLITGSQEARAIAYFVAHKGGYADAQPHLGWVHIQGEATRVQIEPISAQGIAQSIKRRFAENEGNAPVSHSGAPLGEFHHQRHVFSQFLTGLLQFL